MRPAALVLLLAAACNADLAPQWRVVDLRVLAVRAEVTRLSTPVPSGPPLADADSGDVVRLTALVANPRGRAPFRVRFETCVPEATDALPPCLDPARLRNVDALLADPRVVHLGEGTAGRPDEWSVEVTVPDLSAVFERLVERAAADPGFQCKLYVELPVLVVVDAADRRELAVKRVRLSPRSQVAATPLADAYVLNRDPQPTGVYFVTGATPFCASGAPVAVPCGGPDECVSGTCGASGYCEAPVPAGAGLLCAIHDASSLGEYNQCAPDGTRTRYAETIEWQWYATDGDFTESQFTGNVTGSQIEFVRPPGPFTLWTVVRDGRGGEGWVSRTVPAAP